MKKYNPSDWLIPQDTDVSNEELEAVAWGLGALAAALVSAGWHTLTFVTSAATGLVKTGVNNYVRKLNRDSMYDADRSKRPKQSLYREMDRALQFRVAGYKGSKMSLPTLPGPIRNGEIADLATIIGISPGEIPESLLFVWRKHNGITGCFYSGAHGLLNFYSAQECARAFRAEEQEETLVGRGNGIYEKDRNLVENDVYFPIMDAGDNWIYYVYTDGSIGCGVDHIVARDNIIGDMTDLFYNHNCELEYAIINSANKVTTEDGYDVVNVLATETPNVFQRDLINKAYNDTAEVVSAPLEDLYKEAYNLQIIECERDLCDVDYDTYVVIDGIKGDPTRLREQNLPEDLVILAEDYPDMVAPFQVVMQDNSDSAVIISRFINTIFKNISNASKYGIVTQQETLLNTVQEHIDKIVGIYANRGDRKFAIFGYGIGEDAHNFIKISINDELTPYAVEHTQSLREYFTGQIRTQSASKLCNMRSNGSYAGESYKLTRVSSKASLEGVFDFFTGIKDKISNNNDDERLYKTAMAMSNRVAKSVKDEMTLMKKYGLTQEARHKHASVNDWKSLDKELGDTDLRDVIEFFQIMPNIDKPFRLTPSDWINDSKKVVDFVIEYFFVDEEGFKKRIGASNIINNMVEELENAGFLYFAYAEHPEALIFICYHSYKPNILRLYFDKQFRWGYIEYNDLADYLYTEINKPYEVNMYRRDLKSGKYNLEVQARNYGIEDVDTNDSEVITDTNLIIPEGDDKPSADDITNDPEKAKVVEQKYGDKAEEEEENNDSNDNSSNDDDKDDKGDGDKDNDNRDDDDGDDNASDDGDKDDDDDKEGDQEESGDESTTGDEPPPKPTSSEEAYKDVIFMLKRLIHQGVPTVEEQQEMIDHLRFISTVKDISNESFDGVITERHTKLINSLYKEKRHFESIASEGVVDKIKDVEGKISSIFIGGKSAYDRLGKLAGIYFRAFGKAYWADPASLSSHGALEKATIHVLDQIAKDQSVDFTEIDNKAIVTKFFKIPVSDKDQWKDIREQAYKTLELFEKKYTKETILHFKDKDKNKYLDIIRREGTIKSILMLCRRLPNLADPDALKAEKENKDKDDD